MAMHVSGVELTLKGFSTYINNLNKLNKAYAGIDATAEKLRRNVERLASQKERAARSEEVAARAVERAERSYRSMEARLAAYSREQDRLTKQFGTLTQGTKEYERVEAQLNSVTEKAARVADQLANADDRLADSLVRKANAEDRSTDVTKRHQEAVMLLERYLGDTAGKIGEIVFSAKGMTAAMLAGAAAIGAAVLAFKALQLILSAIVGLFNLIRSVASAAIQVVVSFGQLAVNAFKGLLSVLEKITRPLRNFISGIFQVAGGIAFYKWMQAAHNAVVNLTKELINSVSAFQKLEIQLSALAARDYARATGETMAVAFQKTAGAASNLFDWLRKLAVTTPYGVEEISYTFALGQAMGLTTEQAKGMTGAIINYNSAMGLSDEVMQRIIYNFGQMLKRGKLTGEEFRDLSRNFFPVLDILTEIGQETGKTTAEMQELALGGGVPVLQFLEKFISMTERDYPDAAKRMSRTLGSVVQNIKDFIKTFIAVDTLKPVLDRVAERMSNMLDNLLNDERLMASTKMIGQTLVKAFDLLTPAVDALVDAVGRLFGLGKEPEAQYLKHLGDDVKHLNTEVPKAYTWATGLARAILTMAHIIIGGIDLLTKKMGEFSPNIGGTFKTLITRAVEWGRNFIISFAKGLVSAMNFLNTVIIGISNILKKWFKGASPPLIAPDIDKWGAETMNEWLRGFTQADFSIFDSVSGLIESYLRSISNKIGGADNADLVPTILSNRANLMSAIDAVRAGAMGVAQAVSQITGAFGFAQGDFSLYIETLFKIAEAERNIVDKSQMIADAQKKIDLAESLFGIADAEAAVTAASKDVERAQAAVNAISEKYSGILAELNAQLTQATDVYDENARLAEIEEAFATQRLTEEEKARLESEKKAILIKQQIRDVEAQREAELAGAQAILSESQANQKAAEERLATLEAEVETYKAKYEEIIKNAQAEEDAFKASLDALRDQAELYEQRIQAQIDTNNLIQDQLELMDRLKEDAEAVAQATSDLSADLTEPADTSVLDAILKDLENINQQAQDAAGNVFDFLGGLGLEIDTTGLTGAFDTLMESFGNLGKTITGIIGGEGEEGMLDKLQKKWAEIRMNLGLPEDWSPVDAATEAFENLAKWWGENKQDIFDFGEGVLQLGSDLWSFATNAVKSADSIAHSWMRLADAFGLFKEGSEARESINWWVVLAGIATAPLNGLAIAMRFVAGSMDVMSTSIKAFSDIWNALVEGWQGGDTIPPIQSEAWQSILPGLQNLFAELGNRLSNLWSGREYGGPIYKNNPYIVGERGPEVVIPGTSGYVVPSVGAYQNMLMASIQSGMVAAPLASGLTNIDRSTTINMEANYKNVQSEAGVYYDVQAALAAARR